jgi:hypothetical protein
MNHRTLVFLFALFSLINASVAQAQGGRLGAGSPAVSPDVRFEDAPKIGEMVPDLTIVDDQGNPANLRELTTGQYTVLTLGCLT